MYYIIPNTTRSLTLPYNKWLYKHVGFLCCFFVFNTFYNLQRQMSLFVSSFFLLTKKQGYVNRNLSKICKLMTCLSRCLPSQLLTSVIIPSANYCWVYFPTGYSRNMSPASMKQTDHTHNKYIKKQCSK